MPGGGNGGEGARLQPVMVDQYDNILDRQPAEPGVRGDEREPFEPCLEGERHPLLLDPPLVLVDYHFQLPGVAHVGDCVVVDDRLESF